ncbi:hypothetical protein LguiA_029635 [Lonicera macranthoides]
MFNPTIELLPTLTFSPKTKENLMTPTRFLMQLSLFETKKMLSSANCKYEILTVKNHLSQKLKLLGSVPTMYIML